MKKPLLALLLMLLWPVAPALAAPAQEPADLTTLAQAGLSPETSGRYLAQNLNPARRAAPVEAKLLARLGQYGGDSLASAYLDLDKATLTKPHRDFSPEVVEQLMNDKMAAGELQSLLTGEAARETWAPQTTAVSQAAAPATAAPGDIAPPAQSRSAAAAPPPPAERAYQDLRPGQSADPSLKLPPPPQPYDIRRQSLDGPWMGVTERELPDGHVVEVHTAGDAREVGQEVLSRPSGHQVYRYYAGNPDRPASGADPVQEWKNREDLKIIFSPRDR